MLAAEAFHECVCIFRKSVEKTQFALKLDKNNGYYMKTNTNISDRISLPSS